MEDPVLRDPRAYVLPADQTDFPTATRFVNALLETGVTVHRATADFTIGSLEQWEYPFEVIYPPDIDAGNLRDKFDVTILPDGALYEGSPFARFFGGVAIGSSTILSKKLDLPECDAPARLVCACGSARLTSASKGGGSAMTVHELPADVRLLYL